MKQIIKTAAAIYISSLLLLACKKDITQTVKTEGTAAAITLTPSTIVLSTTTASDTVVSITWSRADFGYKAAVNYTVEIVKTGTSFSTAKKVSVGNATQLKYTGAVLNEAAIGLGVLAGTTAVLDIRIKSALSDCYSYYYHLPGRFSCVAGTWRKCMDYTHNKNKRVCAHIAKL
jgi:hypothetical protein